MLNVFEIRVESRITIGQGHGSAALLLKRLRSRQMPFLATRERLRSTSCGKEFGEYIIAEIDKTSIRGAYLLSVLRGGISNRPLPVPDLTPGLTFKGRHINSRPLYSSMTRSARSLLEKSTKQ
jgi:hypothetical protein